LFPIVHRAGLRGIGYAVEYRNDAQVMAHCSPPYKTIP
jgi:hypothetical protein